MTGIANRRRIGTRWLLALVAGACMTSGLLLTAPAAIAAPASRLDIGIPGSNIGTGQPVSLTVVARDATGGTDTSYIGRVHFSSSDPIAGLPSDYTYTSTDQGSHTFTVTFNTAGSQTLRATDANNNAIFGQ